MVPEFRAGRHKEAHRLIVCRGCCCCFYVCRPASCWPGAESSGWLRKLVCAPFATVKLFLF
jgi:hypothetical protein